MRALVAGICAMGVWLAAPSVAHAQGSPIGTTSGDAVFLKDGSVIRGHVTEVREGSHVLVQLDGGQIARVRWDVVARIERAGAPLATGTPQTTTTAPPPSGIPAAPASVEESVIVHIESPEPVRLEVMAGRVGRFVCDSPCDIAVPIHGQYRINGHIRPSKVFSLPGHHGDRVTLFVDPSSTGGFAGGIVLVSVGGVSLVVGALTYLIASIVYDVSNGKDGRGGRTVGLVMMGGGVAAIAGGIVLLALNGKSKVDEQITPAGGAAPAPPPQAWRVFERAPERESIAGASAPPAFVAPITFHF